MIDTPDLPMPHQAKLFLNATIEMVCSSVVVASACNGPGLDEKKLKDEAVSVLISSLDGVMGNKHSIQPMSWSDLKYLMISACKKALNILEGDLATDTARE